MIAKKLKKMGQGTTKEYFKLEIHQLVLNANFVIQEPSLQSAPT